MAETKTKATRTGHLVQIEIFIPMADSTPDSMLKSAHLIKRVEAFKLDEADHAHFEIISAKTRHCQQFAGGTKPAL